MLSEAGVITTEDHAAAAGEGGTAEAEAETKMVEIDVIYSFQLICIVLQDSPVTLKILSVCDKNPRNRKTKYFTPSLLSLYPQLENFRSQAGKVI